MNATIVFTTVAMLAVAAAPVRAQQPVAIDSAARVALGKSIFQGKGLCFSCHGKDGDGVLGPTTRLAGRALVHIKPVLADVVALIKSGVDSAHSTSGQIMPARGGSRISDDEVTAVASYVLDLQARTVKP